MKTYTVADLERMAGKSSVKALTEQAKGRKSLQKVETALTAQQLLKRLSTAAGRAAVAAELPSHDVVGRHRETKADRMARTHIVERGAADRVADVKSSARSAKKTAKKAQAKKASAKKGSSGHRVPEWQIEALQQEAGAAGDHATVNTCKRALAGNAAAMRKVAEIIREAKRAS